MELKEVGEVQIQEVEAINLRMLFDVSRRITTDWQAARACF